MLDTATPRELRVDVGAYGHLAATWYPPADGAATVEVPVLVAYGDVDVSPTTHLEPSFFTHSRDVSLYVLAGSAHCHNMANTRVLLWDRILGWCDTVMTQARR